MLKPSTLVAGLGMMIAGCGGTDRPSPSCESLVRATDSKVLAVAASRGLIDTSRLADVAVRKAAGDSSGDDLIAISWEAPPGAVLLRATCSGDLQRVAELPRVDSLTLVTVQGKRYVAAWYTEGGATAYLGRGMVLYMLTPTTREVWHTDLYTAVDSAGRIRVDSAKVNFGADGITRTTWRTDARGVSAASHSLERFVWSAGRQSFVAM